MKELKIILEIHFMIRRLKSEVLTQLPQKMRYLLLFTSYSMGIFTIQGNLSILLKLSWVYLPLCHVQHFTGM